MTQFLNKVPARTLVYAAILIVLVVIFLVQESGQNRSNVIPLPQFEIEAVSEVRISGPDGELTFRRNPDVSGDGVSSAAADEEATSVVTENPPPTWLMGEEDYPVAEGRIESLLDEIVSLGGADIVTSRGSSDDYGLGESLRRTVRVFTGNLEPVALQLGDTAAAGNAVYGRVNTSREIVLLPPSLDTAVSSDPMRFRETIMVSVPEDRIVEVTINRSGSSPVVVQRALNDEPSSADTEGSSVWTAENPMTGEPMEADILSAFIRELRSLQASAFPEYLPELSVQTESSDGMPVTDGAPDTERAADTEGAADTGSAPAPREGISSPWTGGPAARILVETVNGKTVEISLWPGDDEQVPVRTSESPYDFFIPRWRAQRLMLGLEW